MHSATAAATTHSVAPQAQFDAIGEVNAATFSRRAVGGLGAVVTGDEAGRIQVWNIASTGSVVAECTLQQANSPHASLVDNIVQCSFHVCSILVARGCFCPPDLLPSCEVSMHAIRWCMAAAWGSFPSFTVGAFCGVATPLCLGNGFYIAQPLTRTLTLPLSLPLPLTLQVCLGNGNYISRGMDEGCLTVFEIVRVGNRSAAVTKAQLLWPKTNTYGMHIHAIPYVHPLDPYPCFLPTLLIHDHLRHAHLRHFVCAL
jgi:hypothetical protein